MLKLIDFRAAVLAEAASHFFICCFSGDSDDLGQWRAYDDNGQGFALAFDASEAQLEPVVLSEDERTELERLSARTSDPRH